MAEKTKEIALPLPPIEGVDGTPILRIRGDQDAPRETSVGILRPLEDGKPLPPGADIIATRPRRGSPYLDVKPIYEAESGGRGWKKMSVSRKEFADNWDRIFGHDEDAEDDRLLN